MVPGTGFCLAYVFWHWMRVGGDVVGYEDALAGFQEVLLADAPAGYRGAMVFRQAPAAWLPGRGPHYVDWYLTDGSAALDPLNDAAVSAACRGVHDAAAVGAAGGTAGLYGLRQGVVPAARVRCATWFSKPAGMSYEALDALVAERMDGACGQLWSRRMTLGPTPEMCVLAPEAISLPDAFNAVSVSMELVWPLSPSSLRKGDKKEAAR